VVDDASTDGSAAIVEACAQRDPRVRMVRQSGVGVAAARNAGANATGAGWLAFIDADDVWAPPKIASQLAALAAGGADAGLAYCWFASIDFGGRVVSFGPQPLYEGRALRELCHANWIGNGSALLLRRSAFERAGGYDPALRARGAEGAEDLLIALRIAEHAEFRVVPRYFVGYRQTPASMSTESLQMFRSTALGLAELLDRNPGHAAEIAHHVQESRTWFAYRAGASGRWGEAALLLREAFAAQPAATARYLAQAAVTIAAGRIRRRLGRRDVFPLYGEVVW